MLHDVILYIYIYILYCISNVGAQFGTVISMPLSGVLSRHGFDGGWPSIFYVFGAVGTIWCVAFLLMIYEDPESHPRIAEDEKKYILSALWGNAGASVSSPVHSTTYYLKMGKSLFKSLPLFYLLICHAMFHSLHLYHGYRSSHRYRSGPSL